ncbi:MAG: carboxypeptidase regulatory-like domain-containing protein, partial [Planctomycetes bacterium]|nr:carboxypeptidase regulatory-like domain-containing protein [Planctomycetota bacterium]
MRRPKLPFVLLAMLLVFTLAMGWMLLDGESKAPSSKEDSPTTLSDSEVAQLPNTQAKLPEGVTFVDLEAMTPRERRAAINKSKSPHHFDQGMEYGYLDAEGNWVKVDGPGRLASDGYFYDEEGRRIYARNATSNQGSTPRNATKAGETTQDTTPDSPEENAGVNAVVVRGYPDNAWVEGAKVEVLLADTVLHTGVTNQQGVFQFPLAKESKEVSITLRCSAEGRIDDESEHELDLSEANRLEVQLHALLVLRGVVQDSLGNPLEGALVEPELEEGIYTQSDGRFRGELERVYETDVSVHLAGYQTEHIRRLRAPGSDLVVTLKRAAYVSGRVVDQDGAALPHVRVESRYEPELQHPFVYTVFTDAEGRYRVECPEGAERLRMIYERAGYSRAERFPIRYNREDLDVTLERTDEATVSGVLVFADGSYPREASVAIGERSNYNSYPEGAVHRFEVSFLPMEGEGATLRASGKSFAQVSVDVSSVKKGERKDLGRILVESGEEALIDVFVDGKKIDVELEFRDVLSGESEVSQNGILVLEHAPRNGVISLEYVEGIEAEVDERRFHLSFPSETRLRIDLRTKDWKYMFVRVLEHGTHKPVSGVSIEIGGPIFRTGFWGYETDENGETVSVGRGDPPVLEVFEDDYVQRTFPKGNAFATEEEARKNPVTIEVSPAAKLNVRFSETSEGSYWEVLVEPSARQRYTKDESSGEKAIEFVIPLTTVYLSSPALRIKPRPIEITETKLYEYHIDAIATITVKGTIRKADGTPHANRGFYVFRSKGNGVVTTLHTDAQGRYEFPNAWPGDFHFAIAKDNSEQAAQFFEKISVKSGAQEQEININLPDASATISGIVKYPDGTPVAGATVAMTNRAVTLERGVL